MYIGADPGKEGAIAIIDRDGIGQAFNLPWVGGFLAITECQKRIFEALDGRSVIGFGLERITVYQALPGSKQTIRLQGNCEGQLEAMAKCHGWPLYDPTAKQWQRAVLGKTTKDKLVAEAHVRKRYPSLDLPGNKRYRSGVCDAMCIAEYVRSCVR